MMVSYRGFRRADGFHAEDVGTSRISSDLSVSPHTSTWLNIPIHLNFHYKCVAVEELIARFLLPPLEQRLRFLLKRTLTDPHLTEKC